MYYILIPPLAFAMSRMTRMWHVLVMIIFTVGYFGVYLQTKFNKLYPINIFGEPFQNFLDHFPIFFIGSVVAFFYQKAEEYNISLGKYPFIKTGFGCFSLLYQFFSFRMKIDYYFPDYSYYDNSIFLSIHLFLMLICAPNIYTDFLNQCTPLRYFGKWSYGAYLLHLSILAFLIRSKTINKIFKDDRLVIMVLIQFAVGFVFFHLVEKRIITFANYLISRIRY